MGSPTPAVTRRTLLAAAALAASGLSGCSAPDVLRADVQRQPPDEGQAGAVTAAVAAFSRDLLSSVAAGSNLVCSPCSVLVALAMVRLGATGPTAQEMDAVLHLPGLGTLNRGLNAVEQALAGRSGRRRDAAGGRATVQLRPLSWDCFQSWWTRPPASGVKVSSSCCRPPSASADSPV